MFGLSTQSYEYQLELSDRLHLPFEILSDDGFKLCDELRLPAFEVDVTRLLMRLTLIIRGAQIEHVFYPVFPPNENVEQVRQWLRCAPVGETKVRNRNPTTN